MTKSVSLKYTVIYADDDVDDLQLVQDAFSQYANFVTVVPLNDGVEALSYLKNIPESDPLPCLIILDVNMPRMSGKEALLLIRQIRRFDSVPIILFTTSNQTPDKDFAKRYKAGFITKPIDVRQMHIIINTFMDHCAEEIRTKIKKQTS